MELRCDDCRDSDYGQCVDCADAEAREALYNLWEMTWETSTVHP